MLFLLACASSTCDWPATATAPDGSVEDSCGYWAVPVGEHLYANVYLSEPESPCEAALDPALHLNSDPIYSAMSNDAAKWTYDVVVDAAGDPLEVTVTCDDGTAWYARIDANE